MKANYTPSLEGAKGSVRYYETSGAREGEDRSIWGKDGEISRDEAYGMLDRHHTRSVAATRLVFSIEKDGDADDLRRMTREMMRGLEREREQELHWFAVEHRNTDNPHVHVTLCGSGERETSRGMRERQVKLDRSELAQLREDGAGYCREWERGNREMGRAIDRVLDREMGDIAREREARERERERREQERERERGAEADRLWGGERGGGRDLDRDDWCP